MAVVVTIVGFAVLYPSGIAKRLTYFIGGLTLLVILWGILKPILPANIVERMSFADIAESGGTGRLVIWKSMLREIIEQPEKLLIGRGITALHKLFVGGVWTNTYAHNQFLQTLYNQGLVGLVSFLVLIGVSFFRCLKRLSLHLFGGLK